MDDSTDGVTLYAGFIQALLSQYDDLRSATAAPLFELAGDLEGVEPTHLVPMQRYNDVCTWIEKNLGPANLRRSGRAIGQNVYDQATQDGSLGSNPTPAAILGALQKAASFMIQDPKGRGWEIPESSEGRIVMRRTQTFNCILQEGLLLSLVERTGVVAPRVEHARCTRRGDAHCEYTVTWKAPS